MDLTDRDFENYTSLDGQKQLMITKNLPRYIIKREILKNQQDVKILKSVMKDRDVAVDEWLKCMKQIELIQKIDLTDLFYSEKVQEILGVN